MGKRCFTQLTWIDSENTTSIKKEKKKRKKEEGKEHDRLKTLKGGLGKN